MLDYNHRPGIAERINAAVDAALKSAAAPHGRRGGHFPRSVIPRHARTDARDWPRYDVTLDDRLLTGLPKRHAIYQMFRHLVESGIAPEQVAGHCGPRAMPARYGRGH
jgi:hypothetical protein